MSLDDALLAAHAAGDKVKLFELYKEAAENAGSVNEKCFFLTQAFIFALDVGDPRSAAIKKELVRYGREE